MKLTLSNVRSLKRDASPLYKRVCNYVIDEWGNYEDKVNIFTDLCLAGDRATADGREQGIGYLETRNLKVQYIKEEVMKKMRLFGSENKA